MRPPQHTDMLKNTWTAASPQIYKNIKNIKPIIHACSWLPRNEKLSNFWRKEFFPVWNEIVINAILPAVQ